MNEVKKKVGGKLYSPSRLQESRDGGALSLWQTIALAPLFPTLPSTYSFAIRRGRIAFILIFLGSRAAAFVNRTGCKHHQLHRLVHQHRVDTVCT